MLVIHLSSAVCSSDLRQARRRLPAPSPCAASRGGVRPKSGSRSSGLSINLRCGERPLAADDLAAKLGNEALEPLVTDRARRAIGFGQRRGYSQLVAHEPRQRSENTPAAPPAHPPL